MLEIKLTREIALGNGTRKRGFVLGSVKLTKDEDLNTVYAAMATGISSLADLPGKWKLSDGVIEREVYTALRSPHLFEAIDPKSAAAETKKNDKPPADDWQAIKTETLNLSDDVKAALLKEGWDTAGKVNAAGESQNLMVVLEADQITSVVLELKRISGL